jgi:hypothetical protein
VLLTAAFFYYAGLKEIPDSDSRLPGVRKKREAKQTNCFNLLMYAIYVIRIPPTYGLPILLIKKE